MRWTDGRLIDRQRRPCHGPLYGANDSDVLGLVFSLYQEAPWSVCNRTLPATRAASAWRWLCSYAE